MKKLITVVLVLSLTATMLTVGVLAAQNNLELDADLSDSIEKMNAALAESMGTFLKPKEFIAGKAAESLLGEPADMYQKFNSAADEMAMTAK